MSTFVQLVANLQLECGVSGAAPTTLTGQPAEINRLSNWVNKAWIDIQELHTQWNFLRAAFQFNTTANKSSYTAQEAGIPINADGAILTNWKIDSCRIYLTSMGFNNESFLDEYDWETFRDLYLFGSSRTLQSRPVAVCSDPQKNLHLGQIPDDVYTINGEYFKKPTLLVADGDIPALPTEYHYLIVYRAMMHYGGYEAATEVWERGKDEFYKMKPKLEMDQLQDLSIGPPLA